MFGIRQELEHTGAVRTVTILQMNSTTTMLTGGIDCIGKIWQRNENILKSEFILISEIFCHHDWITSSFSFVSNQKYPFLPNIFMEKDHLEEGVFLTGSKDKLIRVFNIKGELKCTLKGHDGGIISLNKASIRSKNNEYILSGSWDGTGKIWSYINGECLYTIPGHENGVHIIFVPLLNSIITSSTGEQINDHIMNHKLRFWKLIIHSKSSIQCNLEKELDAHNGPIRDLLYEPLEKVFYSCSNDGTITKRNIENGNTISTMIHSGFILTISFIPGKDMNDNRLLSGSEDGTLKIFNTKNGDTIAEIQHPKCIWNVRSVPIFNKELSHHTEFVTASEDKKIRIFTNNEKLIDSKCTEILEQEVALQK